MVVVEVVHMMRRPSERTLVFARGTNRLSLYLRPDDRERLLRLMHQFNASAAEVVRVALDHYERTGPA